MTHTAQTKQGKHENLAAAAWAAQRSTTSFTEMLRLSCTNSTKHRIPPADSLDERASSQSCTHSRGVS